MLHPGHCRFQSLHLFPGQAEEKLYLLGVFKAEPPWGDAGVILMGEDPYTQALRLFPQAVNGLPLHFEMRGNVFPGKPRGPFQEKANEVGQNTSPRH